MTKSLYVIGPPGAGKSTLVDNVVDGLGLSWQPDIRVWRELWINPLTDSDGVVRGQSLGKHRPTYPGTDALSMSVMPRIVEWLHQTEHPEYIIGEGQRLGNVEWLRQLDLVTELLVVYVTAPEAELDARRGELLSATFRKASFIRSYNAWQASMALGFETLAVDDVRGSALELVLQKLG